MPNISSKDLEIIAVKLDQMQEKQTETSKTVGDIHKSLVDPKDGLFPQVADLRRWSQEHEKSDDEMRERVGEIAKMVHPIVRKTESLESWAEEHDESDQNIRESVTSLSKTMEPVTDDYKLRMSRKKWTDKILWFLMAAVLTSLIPTVKYILFDAVQDQDKIEHIEKMLEEDRDRR